MLDRPTIGSMSGWDPTPLESSAPLYVALADAVARDLESGRLRPGDRLPPHRELARRLGINVMTVTRGYAEAARRGLVEGESGRGTFVRGQGLQASERMETTGNGSAQVDFHFNLPAGDPGILDVGKVLASLGTGSGTSAIFGGYAPLGAREHRELGAAWIARSGPSGASPESVVVTGGAQHAMMLATISRTTPGDVLLTDELTFPGIKALAAALHLRVVGIPMDEEGMDPDALRQAARRQEAGLCYTMPNLHNPLGTVMPLARRKALVEVARETGLAVIEDDTYGFLVEDPPESIASIAPERTLHICGTSKSLAAGLRLGFLLLPSGEDAEASLAPYVAATSWMAAPLVGEVVRHLVESGAADRMIAWKRFEARARRDLADATLEARSITGDRGSSHVWLELPSPWRAGEFAALARERGVLVTPAESFVAVRGSTPPAVRICLGTPGSREEVARGLAILEDILRRAPRPSGATV